MVYFAISMWRSSDFWNFWLFAILKELVAVWRCLLVTIFFCGQSTPLGCMCAMDLSHFLSSRRNAWREGNGAVSVTQHTQDSLSFAWTSRNNEIVLFCVILERFHQEPCRIKLAEQDHFNFQSSCTHLLNSSWLSCTVLIKSF